MPEDIQQLKADISFIRGLAQDDGSVLRASGIGLTTAGLVFGFTALRSFAIATGWLHWPEVLRPFMSWDATAVFLILVIALLALSRRSTGAGRALIDSTSRTVWASWCAVGAGYAVAALSMSVTGAHSTTNILFAFWGSGWLIAAAAYWRLKFALFACGCYIVAIISGLLSSTPYRDLLIGVALFVLVALPGILILKDARADY